MPVQVTGDGGCGGAPASRGENFDGGDAAVRPRDRRDDGETRRWMASRMAMGACYLVVSDAGATQMMQLGRRRASDGDGVVDLLREKFEKKGQAGAQDQGELIGTKTAARCGL